MSQGVAGTIYGTLFHALCACNSSSEGGAGRDNAGVAVAVGAVVLSPGAALSSWL